MIATQVWKLDARLSRAELTRAVAPAAELLRAGQLVAIPTETVYGLAADGMHPAAVRSIFAAKGRPADNPLILHVPAARAARNLAADWPHAAALLAAEFWPGPLTLVVKAVPEVPREVTAGLVTVALRVPDHPVALALLKAVGLPLAAPSANRSGRPSPTRAEHVLADLNGRIAGLLDAGPCRVGLESTVVDMTGAAPIILRPGAITREMLSACLQQEVGIEDHADDAPRAPGMKYAHYTPHGAVYQVEGNWEEQVAQLRKACTRGEVGGQRKIALLISNETAQALGATELLVIELGSRDRVDQLGETLFAALRQCDEVGAEIILAETYSERGLGHALMNRLRKAAGGKVWEA